MTSQSATALVLLTPELDPLVRGWRLLYDPSATDGMPAHITLLYPFMPGASIGRSEIGALSALFSRMGVPRFSLEGPERLPGLLYLAPKPATHIRGITKEIWRAFPDFPPYAGKHADITPHLTLAHMDDDRKLDGIADMVSRRLVPDLPVTVATPIAALMEMQDGKWQMRTRFDMPPT